MTTLGLSDTLRTARAQKIIDAINTGTGTGTLELYSAPKPMKGAAITSQTKAGTLTFAEPAGTISNGVLTFSTMTDDSNADETCWIRWARVLDGDGAFVMDLDVSETDGTLRASDGTSEGTNTNAIIKMASAHVYQGGVLHMTSAVLTEGNAT